MFTYTYERQDTKQIALKECREGESACVYVYERRMYIMIIII
jgi:hypothetical protein